MSDYIVSARKYRPSTFRSVVGQKSLTTTLKNAIDNKRLAQAYLFCGPRGVGKTSCARIFAKTINCLHPTEDGEACGECESCRGIDQGNSFNVVELDAASNNSVDDIRKLTDEVNVPPQVGKFRVFIIDEVHMLSTSAFNAFLKTLEEPPKYAVFILATTEKHKVIPTILSRCQIYDFKRITTADMVEHLQYVAGEEGIKASVEALNVIARKADGAMRDALSIFDQVAASSMGDITYQSALANLNVLDYDYFFRLVEAFRAGDVGQALLIFNEIVDRGFDTLFFINGLASHIRDLMVAADQRTAKLLEVAEEVVEKYTAQAQSLPLQWYFAALKLINDADMNYRTATNKRMLVELLLIRLCQLLNPLQPPFDRIDNEPPLSMPGPINQTYQPERGAPAPSPATEPQSSAPQENPAPKAETDRKEPAPEPQAQTVRPVTAATTKEKHVAKGTKRAKRLSDLEAEYDNSVAERKERRNRVEKEALDGAWAEFIAENPEKQILVGAMKAAYPQPVREEEYLVKVQHPAQEQAFSTYMGKLLEYLRNKLENDYISIKVEIQDSGEIKKPMPTKQFFQDILASNPSIAEMARNLDVEII
ncbi:MAG: DNA polymerase III subunit gamma/tau [Muribaculaceae bacterium]|nr:DNA polymerase III subunit gamma/tau [Muribaculaceae bacterium]